MVRTRWFITLTEPILGYQTNEIPLPIFIDQPVETAKVKKTQKNHP